MPRRRYRRHQNACERCGCPLDAGEGRYCEECLEKIREEEAYAMRWNLTMEQVREIRESGLVSA